MRQTISKSLYWLMILMPVTALVTASLGAWTRLADAGLGCPDWPGCYGFALLPSGESDIALAESRYPDTPYEPEKALLEVVHRYIASLTGLLILIATALLFLGRQPAPMPTERQRSLRNMAVLASVLVCIQGLFGYLTVSLKLWPQVVSTHLLGGMAVLSLTWFMYLHAVARPDRPGQLARAGWLALVALLGQMMLGVWVSSNYAALACTDFPTCQGQWWPPTDFAGGFDLTHPPGPNYLHGQLDNHARAAIHLSHRLGAIAASAALIYLAIKALKIGLTARGTALLALLATQLTLGVLNVVLILPLPIAIGHHLVAALLLLTVITLLPVTSPLSAPSTGREAKIPMTTNPAPPH